MGRTSDPIPTRRRSPSSGRGRNGARTRTPDIDIVAGTLFVAGTLIAILTIATAAVLVAGRMASRIRQVGTLKAVGVTPRQIVLALLFEYGAVAIAATVLGIGVGLLLAPVIANTSVTILGTPQPQLTWTQVAIVGESRCWWS